MITLIQQLEAARITLDAINAKLKDIPTGSCDYDQMAGYLIYLNKAQYSTQEKLDTLLPQANARLVEIQKQIDEINSRLNTQVAIHPGDHNTPGYYIFSLTTALRTAEAEYKMLRQELALHAQPQTLFYTGWAPGLDV